MEKIKIDNKLKTGIKKWLDLDREKKKNTCPFIFVDSVRRCESICFLWFPKIIGRKTPNFKIQICPCGVYPLSYVIKKAKRVISYEEKK